MSIKVYCKKIVITDLEIDAEKIVEELKGFFKENDFDVTHQIEKATSMSGRSVNVNQIIIAKKWKKLANNVI